MGYHGIEWESMVFYCNFTEKSVKFQLFECKKSWAEKVIINLIENI